jgi:glutathione synthase/RimK-type ligase-like ATP-grasp enzyme
MLPDLHAKINSSANLNVHSLLVSQDLMSKLELADKQSITLQFGQSAFAMQAAADTRLPPNHLKMNPAMFVKTGIQKNIPYAIKKQEQTLCIGPYIGISANLEPDKGKPFGTQTFFIRQLIEQAQLMGAVCFAFSMSNIDLKKAQIQGYTYSNNGWVKGLYPLPDVIYPRCNSEFNRYSVRQALQKKGVRFLNPPGIGKWGTYKTLVQNARLARYLPDTRLINSFSDLDEMLHKYHHIYMKPITGSQGKYIIKVSQRGSPQSYEYQYQIKQRQISGKAGSIQELERKLRLFMGSKRYLAQQQIELLSKDGCIMDLRVMTQKNRSGKWMVTGNAFRIGKAGSITSNISGGGSIGDVQTCLNLHFDEKQCKKIMNDIEFLALETARTLETRLGPTGELGIDIGVDRRGKIWLIEANLKPARKIFLLLKDNDSRLLSVRRPIEYAIYLAGF